MLNYDNEIGKSQRLEGYTCRAFEPTRYSNRIGYTYRYRSNFLVPHFDAPVHIVAVAWSPIHEILQAQH